MSLGVAGTIDVAEGAIAHLLKKYPSLEAGVLGELGLGSVFFSDELGQIGVVDTSTCAFGGRVFLAGHLFGGFGILGCGGRLRDKRIGN